MNVSKLIVFKVLESQRINDLSIEKFQRNYYPSYGSNQDQNDNETSHCFLSLSSENIKWNSLLFYAWSILKMMI